MRLKSALRRGVAAAVIAGIVVSSGIPAYAARWDIANGDITVKAGDTEGTNKVTQGETIDKDDTNTVITGESDKNTVTIDTSKGDVDVTFDDLKIDVSGKAEGDVSGDGPVDAGKAAVTVQGDHDAAIELDGANELKSSSHNAGLEKNDERSEDGKTISGKLTIKDDNDTKGTLAAHGFYRAAGDLDVLELAARNSDGDLDLVVQAVHGRGVHAVSSIRPSRAVALALHDGLELAHSAERGLRGGTAGEHRLGEEHAVLVSRSKKAGSSRLTPSKNWLRRSTVTRPS